MMTSFAARTLALVLLTGGLLVSPIGTYGPWSTGIAWADDDDEGTGDDDEGTSDGQTAADNNASSGQTGAGRSRLRPVDGGPIGNRSPGAVVVKTLPDFAPEIVVLGLSSPDLAILLQEGYGVLETQVLAGTGADLLRLAPPPAIGLQAARDRVRQLPSGFSADFNHFYRPNEDVVPASADISTAAAGDYQCTHANCAAHDLVQWPSSARRARQCPSALSTIGIIDTGVNTTHDLIDGSRIETVRLGSDAEQASRQIHGTAVVSALAGRVGSRVEGLLPEARFLVVDVFSVIADDERADVFSLIRGLDLMGERGIRVVNLSLAGPANVALGEITQQLVVEKQMILVAAVGNGGPDKPVAFPAALPGVIGVTAVDRRGRLYGDAQRGPEVDIAAPGVGLLLATSVKGAKEKTGTSFAAPFITASAAVLVATDPLLTPEQVALRLSASARDLGEAGADPLFGAGLLQTAGLCP
jgi:minor extracellular protease Epr